MSSLQCKISKSVAKCAKTEPSIITRDLAWDPKSSTHRLDDDRKPRTRVDAGVFLANQRTEKVVTVSPEAFVKATKMSDPAKKKRKEYIGRCSYADLVVPIEIKIDHSHSPFDFMQDGNFLRTHTDGGRTALGQIGEYCAQVFGHQHRTHLYALYIYTNQARILYLDRSGGIVSQPFQWGLRTQPTLHRFFWRLARMSREQIGFDRTVVPAEPADVERMLEYAAKAPTEYIQQRIYHTLSWNHAAKKSTSNQWPAQQVTVEGRKFIIARPTFSSPSLFGRCTRGFLAYDVDHRTTRFLKDCWRLDHDRIQAEHDVYARLKAASVQCIMECLCGEDVTDDAGHWQRTKTQHARNASLPARGHYRLLFEKVCRPLIDFKDFMELAALLADAMTGTHIHLCRY